MNSQTSASASIADANHGPSDQAEPARTHGHGHGLDAHLRSQSHTLVKPRRTALSRQLRTIADPRELKLPALRLTRSLRVARQLGWWMGLILIAFPLFLALTPWIQVIEGQGRVAAFGPLERRFNIEAPISGVVVKWHVTEGSEVKVGDLLATLSNNDRQFVEALEEQKQAIIRERDTAQREVDFYETIIADTRKVMEAAVAAAEKSVEATEQKVEAVEKKVEAFQAVYVADFSRFRRFKDTGATGVVAPLELDIAEGKARESRAKVEEAKAELKSSEADLAAKRAFLEETRAKMNAEVQKALVEQQKAIAKVEAKNKELQDVLVKIRQQENREVRAVRNGRIFRILVNEQLMQVKEGEPLAQLIPETDQPAVELWVAGNDAPLIHLGDPVRLQFEGWPAAQVVGWPSVAVGTFAGEVKVIDTADDGMGRFRIVVVPAEGESWPEARYLRQGVRAKGWVLLSQVSLGFELWRRLNGFPPMIKPFEDGPGIGDYGKGVLGDAKATGDDKAKLDPITPKRLIK